MGRHWEQPGARTQRLPYPFNSPWVWKIAARYGLPVWFAALGLMHAIFVLILPGYSAIDARIYWLAARLWITGGDPWSANVMADGFSHHFAAPPVNLLPFVPFALLPEPVAAAAVLMITWIAGYLIVRRMGLPLWWLLFPPMLEGFVSGNPQILLTLLLVVGSAPLAAIASTLKIYALVPLALLGRWRSVLASALVLLASVAATWTLWPEYIRRFGEISARLDVESFGGYSATYLPILLVPTAAAIAALLLLRRPEGAWLAVPALWPSSEAHYATFALPVMNRWLAWTMAIPFPLVAPLATMALAVARIWQWHEGTRESESVDPRGVEIR